MDENEKGRCNGCIFYLHHIVPFVFIDVTKDKNTSFNSYAEREEYIRKLAADKNCTDLPKPYEFPSASKQTTFVPSGGNVKQEHPIQK